MPQAANDQSNPEHQGSRVHDSQTDPAGAAESDKAATPKTAAEKYFDALKNIDAYIEGSIFGRVHEFKKPFTRQYKHELFDRFPNDRDIYAKADKLQTSSSAYYAMMRIITGVLFMVLLIVAWACHFYLFDFIAARGSDPAVAHLAVLAIVAACGLLLLASRRVARWVLLNLIIGNKVRELAYSVSSKFDKLVTDTNGACGQIDLRADFGTNLSWPERAKGWTKIALWRAIRCGGLDRYTTAVFWKAQVTDTITERISRTAKCALLAIALPCMFAYQTIDVEHSGIGAWPVLLAAEAAMLVCWYFKLFHKRHHKDRAWKRDSIYLFLPYLIFATCWSVQCRDALAEWPAVLLGALLTGAFWFGWIVDDERDNHELVSIFTDELKTDEVMSLNTAYYFEAISKRVENLILEIMHAGRISPTSATAQPKADEVGLGIE
jgi:hypothetical protein